MKRLSILGSTGSIGQNTLKIVSQFPEQFQIVALAAKSSIDLLADQIERHHPLIAVVFDETAALKLKQQLGSSVKVEILWGEEGYIEAATLPEADMVVGAMVGAAGLKPTIAAIENGKDIALANKETLVMAGEIVMNRVIEKKVHLLPVDSEHSAIFQSLEGQRKKDLDHIVLTASGGPFLNLPLDQFPLITPEKALKHPNWSMGSKITIDSSTLMNKGLEVIEAKWLFDVSVDQIKVLVHPESIVHSMAAFVDGSVIAQLGIPDMKGAIAYGLSYPDRLPLKQPFPDFGKLKALTFQSPDFEKFPCLSLAFSALSHMGTMPAVLNAANEIAVDLFLHKQIAFADIYTIVRGVMDRHDVICDPDLDDILTADAWARREAQASTALVH